MMFIILENPNNDVESSLPSPNGSLLSQVQYKTSLPTAHLENCFLIVVSGVTPTRKCDFSAYKTVCFETFYYKTRVKQYNTIT
jgi:hypothetical protein